MRMNKKKIDLYFEHYREMKESETRLKDGNRADTTIITKKMSKKIKFLSNMSIYPKSILNTFSPNKIDNRYFWKKATDMFSLGAISGEDNKDKIELNEKIIENLHKPCGAIKELDDVFEKNQNAKILEIGPGHGSLTQYLALNHNLKNYYAIDIHPLFKFRRLYKTDGKSIPKIIPNELDIIYSINVFQHLTPEQRMNYYKQIKNKLKVGGKFIFSMFVLSEKNKNIIIKDKEGNYETLFGVRDKSGNCYTQYFGQFTRINKLEEIEKIFKELNMDFKIIHCYLNNYTMIATKL